MFFLSFFLSYIPATVSIGGVIEDVNILMTGSCMDELLDCIAVHITDSPTHRALHVQVCREGPAFGGDTQHDGHCLAGTEGASWNHYSRRHWHHQWSVYTGQWWTGAGVQILHLLNADTTTGRHSTDQCIFIFLGILTIFSFVVFIITAVGSLRQILVNFWTCVF